MPGRARVSDVRRSGMRDHAGRAETAGSGRVGPWFGEREGVWTVQERSDHASVMG